VIVKDNIDSGPDLQKQILRRNKMTLAIPDKREMTTVSLL